MVIARSVVLLDVLVPSGGWGDWGSPRATVARCGCFASVSDIARLGCEAQTRQCRGPDPKAANLTRGVRKGKKPPESKWPCVFKHSLGRSATIGHRLQPFRLCRVIAAMTMAYAGRQAIPDRMAVAIFALLSKTASGRAIRTCKPGELPPRKKEGACKCLNLIELRLHGSRACFVSSKERILLRVIRPT
jgi:hypothetical protein